MRSIRTPAAMLVAALFLASCAGGAAVSTSTPGTDPAEVPPDSPVVPSPSSTPEATPTPSPSPVDASDAFNQAFGDPLFQARMTVRGSMTVGRVAMAIGGVIEVRPGASHSVLTVATSTGDQVTETISYGGRKYELQHGAWFDTGPVDASGDLAAVLADIGGFRDTGVETKGGRSLHHMELPAGTALPAAAFGLDDEGISNVELALEAWAEEDGTPALMAVEATWDQPAGNGTVAASMAVEYTFNGVSVTVSQPTELWAWRTSKVHGYTAAYPADWDAMAGSKKRPDVYMNFDGTWIAVSRSKQTGVAFNAFVTAFTRNISDFTGLKGAKVDSNTALKLDGVKARQIAVHGKYQGDRMWGVTVVAIKDGRIYVVEYYLFHQPSEAEMAEFQTFLATFSFK